MLFKSIGTTILPICLKIIFGLRILFAGGFLTLHCDVDATYKVSLCCNDFFCSLPNMLVCIISGGYMQYDFSDIFSAAMICVSSKKSVHVQMVHF